MAPRSFVLFEKSRQARVARKVIGDSLGPMISLQGHCFRAVSADEDDETLKPWSAAKPLIPEGHVYRWVFDETGPRDQVKMQREAVREVGKLLKTAQTVYLATDDDAEGEWIGWSVLEHHGWSIKTHGDRVLRVPLLVVDETSVKAAFAGCFPSPRTYGRALAARTRAEADMSVGYTMTRLLTTRLRPANVRDGDAIRYGRVKSAVLGILCAREAAVQGHVEQLYYVVRADVAPVEGGGGAVLQYKPADPIFDLATAQEIGAAVAGQTARVNVTHGEKASRPPPFFSTQTMEREAARRFGWSAAHTAAVAQRISLEGLITYPRTNGDALDVGMKARMGDMLDVARQVFPDWATPDTAVCRKDRFLTAAEMKAKEFAHDAIVPNLFCDGGLAAAAAGLGGDDAKLFALVMERTVAAVSGDAKSQTVAVQASVPGPDGQPVVFKASASQMHDPGWKALSGKHGKDDDDDGDDDSSAYGQLAALRDGAAVVFSATSVETCKMPRPQRFKAADLTTVMAEAWKYVEDRDLREILKHKASPGVGTGATRSGIEKDMYESHMIVKQGAFVVPTERYRAVWERVCKVDQALFDPGVSALWEVQFGAIADGDLDPLEFHETMRADLLEHIAALGDVAPLDMAIFEATSGGGRSKGGRKPATRGKSAGGRQAPTRKRAGQRVGLK